MDTDFKNWVEWKEKCDIRLCGLDTQSALLKYVNNRIKTVIDKSASVTKRIPIDTTKMTGWDWWHLTNSYYADLQKDGKAKRYKDELFQRVSRAPQNTPAYVTEAFFCQFNLTSVVRNFLRKQCRRNVETVSFEDPTTPDPAKDNTTWKDRIGSPPGAVYSEAIHREHKQIATDFSGRFFKTTNHRERVSLTAIYLRLPLSAPEVMAAAGCKHAVLSTAPKKLTQRLVNELRGEMPVEAHEDLETLARLALESLEEMCHSWAKSEKVCKSVFYLYGERKPRD